MTQTTIILRHQEVNYTKQSKKGFTTNLYNSLSRVSRKSADEKCPHGRRVVVFDTAEEFKSHLNVRLPHLLCAATRSDSGYVPSVTFFHIQLAHFHTHTQMVSMFALMLQMCFPHHSSH